MIILKNNNITIPRGISPSFVTTDHDISLQKKSVTITKNGVSTITPDPSYDAISSVRVTTDVHLAPKLQNIVKTYVENGNYRLAPGDTYDGIGNVSITIDVPEKVFKTQDKNISITENGDYNVSKDSSFDGMNNVSISVNVPEKVINLQDKNENIVSNGDYRYIADESFDGLNSVNVHVEVPEKKIILQNKDITENGSVTYDEGYDGLGTVNVNITIPEYKSQTKEVSYDKNGSFTLKPDSSFDGISQANITVNVPDKVYKTQEKTLAKSDLITNTNKSVTVELVPDSSFAGMSKVSYEKIKLNDNFTVEFRTPSDDKFNVLNLNVPVGGFDGVSKFSYKTRRQDKTVTPSTTKQIVNCDQYYVGLRSVTVNPVDKILLRYIECDGNTFFKLISTNDTLNLLNSYTCDIQCSFTQAVSITSKSTFLSFVNKTGSSHESEVQIRFGLHSSGINMLQTYVHGEDKNILINNDYSQYTLGDETCIDVQIHNSVDSSTASNKLVVSDISGASRSNINTTLPNELIAFGNYSTAGNIVCTSSSGYRIHRIILHRDQVAAQTDKTRTYYEFIPVLHDGKPCFFETSTKTYRYNLGTGTPKYEIL